jgi:cellulose synthase operon protein C
LLAARVRRREYDEALAVLDNMAKKRPGLASHLELRGRVLLDKRDFAAARQAFEQAFKADPGLFGAISSLVSLDLYEKQPARAMERLQAVIAASPQNSLALLMLAELKTRNGAPLAEIKQLLLAAVKASPTMVEPRLRLINFALQKRQFKEALTYAQDALVAMPGDTGILDTVGRAQMQAGDIEQATSTFRKLAAAMPNSALPYLRIADAYLSAARQRCCANGIH